MKVERHSKIVELIGKYEIETQEELAEKLNQSGFNVTQATVSRDIRELKLTKIQEKTEDNGIWFLKVQRNLCDQIYPYFKGWFYVHGYGTEHSCDQDRSRYGNGSGGRPGRHPFSGGSRLYCRG